MSNYILTLKLKTEKYHEDILNKRLEIGRHIYNSCLGELLKRYKNLKQSKVYQTILKMEKGKDRNKKFNELNKEYGLTEYSLHAYVKPMQKHFKKNIDSMTSQKIATRCFNAFQKLMLHQANKVNFKRYGEMNSVEGKANRTGIRFIENQLVWNKLNVPVVIGKNDMYAHIALQDGIKYCRIIRKLIRGRYAFYIQLIMEGIPPKKYNIATGEVRHMRNEGSIGIDIGTQTIAISSEKEVKLLELAPEVNDIEKEKRILSRKLDRQRKSSNPHKYNEDGTFKKRSKERWIWSKNYTKTKNQLNELQRKVAAKRKQSHEQLANYILTLGDNVKVEQMNYKGLQAKAKETTINEKTGKFNKKKRFGKSLANKAPSMFLFILNNKLKFHDKELNKIDTISFKASQYNHFTNGYVKKTLSERWNEFECGKIQRDLYSAFLIMNSKSDLKSADRKLCSENWSMFKQLHDIEIERIKNSKSKLISSMGI
ncbi:RNA-guided endonuclease TnpB family protein [Priestia megaterium]|uniref:RNA-guided endonuclease TnpB family protein n=1 Tax=Priestia megaterium TaxID=1404 RepID=UPI003CC5B706